MSKCVDTREAYENLANAVIVSAASDYKAALKRLKRNPANEMAAYEVKRLERFFRSEWYEMLTDVDATYLLRKICGLVEEGC